MPAETGPSWWDYDQGRDIRFGRSQSDDPYFSALLTAVILKADPSNLERLRAGFPEFVEVVTQRFNAPNGILPSDPIDRILSELEVPAEQWPAIRERVLQVAS